MDSRPPREAADYFVRQGTDPDGLMDDLATPAQRRRYIATFYTSRFWPHPAPSRATLPPPPAPSAAPIPSAYTPSPSPAQPHLLPADDRYVTKVANPEQS